MAEKVSKGDKLKVEKWAEKSKILPRDREKFEQHGLIEEIPQNAETEFWQASQNGVVVRKMEAREKWI